MKYSEYEMAKSSRKREIGELGDVNTYLVDLGSTLQLFGAETENFIRGKGKTWRDAIECWNGKRLSLPKTTQRGMAWACIAQGASRNVQRAVEMMVTSDSLVFDSALSINPSNVGFDLRRSWAFQNGFVSQVDISETIRRSTWEFLNSFRTNEMETLYGRAFSPHGDRNPFHSGDKQVHDYGFGLHEFNMSWFADSNDHPIRAVYYLHLSERFGVPLCVSDRKLAYWDSLLVRGEKEIRSTIDPQEVIESRVIPNRIREEILPPIFEMVVVYALKNEVSPGAAIKAIRSSHEAKSYREKLVELRMNLNSPTLPRQNIAEKYLMQLERLGNIWSFDPNECIRYKTDATKSAALLRLIPYAGNLLAQILTSKVQHLLGQNLTNPDPVHLFISRWFRFDEEKFERMLPDIDNSH